MNAMTEKSEVLEQPRVGDQMAGQFLDRFSLVAPSQFTQVEMLAHAPRTRSGLWMWVTLVGMVLGGLSYLGLSSEDPAGSKVAVARAEVAEVVEEAAPVQTQTLDIDEPMLVAQMSEDYESRPMAKTNKRPQDQHKLLAKQAWRLVSERDFAAAESLFEELLAQNGDDARSIYGLSLCQFELGKDRQALASIQRMGDRPGPEGKALLLAGAIAQVRGDEEGARRSYRLYLAKFPNGLHAQEIRDMLARDRLYRPEGSEEYNSQELKSPESESSVAHGAGRIAMAAPSAP